MRKIFEVVIALVIIICLIVVININNTWWFNIIGAITGIESNVARWIIAGILDLIVTIIIITISFKTFNKGGEE